MLNVYFKILVPNMIVFIKKKKKPNELTSHYENGDVTALLKIMASWVNVLVHKLQESRFTPWSSKR